MECSPSNRKALRHYIMEKLGVVEIQRRPDAFDGREVNFDKGVVEVFVCHCVTE
jgi:hypothetical protein